MANDWVSGSNTPAVAHNRGGTGGVRSSGTVKYGSLDETEAFKIQKKFLSIAKRNIIFSILENLSLSSFLISDSLITKQSKFLYFFIE